MRQIIYTTMIVLVAFTSCRRDNDKVIKYGYHFFPIDEGHYVIYDVLDVFHDSALIPAHDTSRYQIKELISESYEDETGEISQKLKRYIRSNDTLPWTIKDIWSVKRTPRNAQVVEENKRRIKMAFAISYDQDWDGNALNNDESQFCYYKNIYEPMMVGEITHDSSVTVEHKNFISYIQYQREYAVYAPHIGKVYDVRKNLDINYHDTLHIRSGTELFYTAISWGKE